MYEDGDTGRLKEVEKVEQAERKGQDQRNSVLNSKVNYSHSRDPLKRLYLLYTIQYLGIMRYTKAKHFILVKTDYKARSVKSTKFILHLKITRVA